MAVNNVELMNAVLAMDSYNRNAELNLQGSSIGNYTIRETNLPSGSAAAGFYAEAYDLKDSNGNVTDTVISYRGTDDPNPLSSTSDVWSGWLAGGGFIVDQPLLAGEFYQDVIGTIDPYAANVSFTGHSLGGGLAGMMGSVYSKEAVVFNNMPFSFVSGNIHAVSDPNNPAYNLSYAQEVRDAFFFNGTTPQAIDDSNVSGFATDEESLEYLRIGDSYNTYLQSEWDEGITNAVNLHSQALLVTLMFEDHHGFANDWHEVAPDMMDALFDDTIGVASGSTNADTMLNKMAYSALQEGQRPFGDTALWSLFGDANNLGKAVKDAATPSELSDEVQNALSDILVQYAGHLADNDVHESAFANVIGGALNYHNGQLTVNLDADQWASAGNGAKQNIVGFDQLANEIFGTGHAWSASQVNHIYISTDAGNMLEAQSTASGTTSNIFFGQQGDDTLIGDQGMDRALYEGNSTDYNWTYDDVSEEWTVTDNRTGSPEGTDTLKDIDVLVFSDTEIKLEDEHTPPAGPGGGGGNSRTGSAPGQGDAQLNLSSDAYLSGDDLFFDVSVTPLRVANDNIANDNDRVYSLVA